MHRPAELKSDQILKWSPGRGTDLWDLFQTCIAGDLPGARALVKRDPSLVRAHYAYRKPLYFAVRENRLDVARFLLERDHNPLDLWVDDDPLDIARDRGYGDMERLLTDTLAMQFNASPAGEPVAQALRDHDIARVRTLLDAHPGLVGSGDRRSSQPIHWATMTRQLEAIDELLRRGADINARRMDGAQPIHVTNGDYFYRGWRDVPSNWPVSAAEVMSHLVAKGAAIDLPTACHTGNIDRVRALLQLDPSLANKSGVHEGYYPGAGAPLANAAGAGRMDIVQLLLEHGADPNLREEQYAPHGRALYSAVYHGHVEVAKLLLERGAFPNPEVESSGSALWVSQEWRPDKRIEELLLSHGATPPAPDPAEDWDTSVENWLCITPLHHAAGRGDLEEAKKQLGLGANLTARDEHLSSTPLGWAAKSGQLEMVNFLLDLGAPTSLPDDPVWATPHAWADRRGHAAIAKLLQA